MKTMFVGCLMKSRLWVERRGRQLWADRRGFGMNELLGIAAALIIAGLVIIPGFKGLADSMIDGLEGWWKDIADIVFPSI